jgi:hypothetical protein
VRTRLRHVDERQSRVLALEFLQLHRFGNQPVAEESPLEAGVIIDHCTLPLRR